MEHVFELKTGLSLVTMYQAIAARLMKIQSLINIALHEQLFDEPSLDHQHYLWVLKDLVDETQSLSHSVLSNIDRIK